MTEIITTRNLNLWVWPTINLFKGLSFTWFCHLYRIRLVGLNLFYFNVLFLFKLTGKCSSLSFFWLCSIGFWSSRIGHENLPSFLLPPKYEYLFSFHGCSNLTNFAIKSSKFQLITTSDKNGNNLAHFQVQVCLYLLFAKPYFFVVYQHVKNNIVSKPFSPWGIHKTLSGKWQF